MAEKLDKKEIKRIKQERKKLRKDLRAKGIKSKEEFDITARELGLSLPERKRLFPFLPYLFKSLGLKGLMALLSGLLGVMFLMAMYSEAPGNFTINLTAKMVQEGFSLYDTNEFLNGTSRLVSEAMVDVNNISIDEIPKDIHLIDGSHNGDNYVAYTFYIRNEGEMASTYQYNITIDSTSLGAEKATWLLFFEDDKQLIYAQANNDEAEMLYKFVEPPFYEQAYTNDQYEQGGVGLMNIKSTPFVSDEIVLQGLVEDLGIGEYKKYTVVIWIEGDDPDCTNAIFGGHVRLSMKFDLVPKDANRLNLFKGLFRTEYEFIPEP